VRLDPVVIATRSLELVRPLAQAKGLSLAMAADPSVELVADPLRLRQILLNLLGNALKFTESGSVEVRLRALKDRPAVRIEVADTGSGIDPEQRTRLFQDFERLQADSTAGPEGAGLGLALSARLAVLMGGRLGHHDNAGGGSIFWLELPNDMTARALETAPAPPALTVTHASAEKLRVLVVDDVAMNCDIACAFLKLAGHTPTAAMSGAEALAALTADVYDVVLMDVCMPGMDGLEATRRIRALSGANRDVPIIGLTAQAFAEQITACLQAGMNDHLSKPYTPDGLADAVRQAHKVLRT
jgi:CheY-like chemotaxis protein